MTAKLLDGKQTADAILDKLKRKIEADGNKPGLAAIIVGDNPASRLYVNIKRKTCERVGIHSELFELPGETTEEALIALIHELIKKIPFMEFFYSCRSRSILMKKKSLLKFPLRKMWTDFTQ